MPHRSPRESILPKRPNPSLGFSGESQAGTKAPSQSSSGTDAHAGSGPSFDIGMRQASEYGSSQQLAVHFSLPPHLHEPPSNNDPQGLSVTSTQDDYITWPSTAHSAPSSCPSSPPSDMLLLESSTEHVEILLPSENLVLRGVGQDVEPTMLSGQVVLRLAETAHIREINLTLIGKSRLPQADGHTPSFRQQRLATNVIFSHEWTLLQTAKGQKQTLAPGQHVYPFQLNVDDTFPVSVNVGGSEIAYKLRANVVRSSFSSNWVARRNLNIVRGFLPEALEYTQSLEIENTWPGKIMYSLMIPHKAFAVGDEIPVSLKFSPLVKGCSVLSIDTEVKQYLSIKSRSMNPLQDSKSVAHATHIIRDGRAVNLLVNHHSEPAWDVNTSFGRSDVSHTATSSTASLPATVADLPVAGPSRAQEEDAHDGGETEVNTSMTIRLPASVTPTNDSNPISVHHKIKWAITLSNLDGHTSELRCALPIHILHPSLLEEAREASQQTRSILFPSDEAQATQVVLPSYGDHLRDRVANALDAVGPVRLAPNPLHNINPDSASSSPPSLLRPTGYFSGGSSATGTPASTPGPQNGTYSDPSSIGLVDNGLLLSLGGNLPAPASVRNSLTRTDDSHRSSHRTSHTSSGNSSRATSPEPSEASTPPITHAVPEPIERHRHGFFSLTSSLKPFSHFSKHHKHSSHNQISPMSSRQPSPAVVPRALGAGSRQSSISNLRAEAEHHTTPLETMSELLNQVPNYERATQGFLGGGVPPLDVSAGLPSYGELDGLTRVHSEGSILRLANLGNPVIRLEREASNVSTASRPVRASRRPSSANEDRRRTATFLISP